MSCATESGVYISFLGTERGDTCLARLRVGYTYLVSLC